MLMFFGFLLILFLIFFILICSQARRKKEERRSIEIQWEIIRRCEAEGRWEEAAEIREMLNPNIYK